MIINFTAGMGGDLTLGSTEKPMPPSPVGTDMAGATERLAHVAKLLPEICTLDCGTMNFGEGDYVMTNTPAMLKAMAALIQASASSRRLRFSIPAICCWPNGCTVKACSTIPSWCSSAWAFPGARRTTSRH